MAVSSSGRSLVLDVPRRRMARDRVSFYATYDKKQCFYCAHFFRMKKGNGEVMLRRRERDGQRLTGAEEGPTKERARARNFGR